MYGNVENSIVLYSLLFCFRCFLRKNFISRTKYVRFYEMINIFCNYSFILGEKLTRISQNE